MSRSTRQSFVKFLFASFSGPPLNPFRHFFDKFRDPFFVLAKIHQWRSRRNRWCCVRQSASRRPLLTVVAEQASSAEQRGSRRHRAAPSIPSPPLVTCRLLLRPPPVQSASRQCAVRGNKLASLSETVESVCARQGAQNASAVS